MSVAQTGSYGHIRRLQGRITILYVDARQGDSVRTLAEMIMDVTRELLRAVVT
jgi:hypothetical protein